MTYFVTIQHTQNFTYTISAQDEKDAMEQALYLALQEEKPYDIDDVAHEVKGCINKIDYLFSIKKIQNNEKREI